MYLRFNRFAQTSEILQCYIPIFDQDLCSQLSPQAAEEKGVKGHNTGCRIRLRKEVFLVFPKDGSRPASRLPFRTDPPQIGSSRICNTIPQLLARSEEIRVRSFMPRQIYQRLTLCSSCRYAMLNNLSRRSCFTSAVSCRRLSSGAHSLLIALKF